MANFSCQNSTSCLLIHYRRAYKPSSNLTNSQRVLEIPHTYGWDPLKGCRQVALLLKQASESPGNLLKQTADSVGLIWAQEFAFLAISCMTLMLLMPWPWSENRCINPCALTSSLERYWLFSTHTNFKVKKIRKTAKTLKNSFAALTYSRDPGFHNHLLKSLLLILWPSGFWILFPCQDFQNFPHSLCFITRPLLPLSQDHITVTDLLIRIKAQWRKNLAPFLKADANCWPGHDFSKALLRVQHLLASQ